MADSLTEAFARLRADLRQVVPRQSEGASPAEGDEEQRESPAVIFARLRGDLGLAAGQGVVTTGDQVSRLEARWGAMVRKALEPTRDYERLFDRLDQEREPACLGLDLLGLSGQTHKETVHTQVLARLMQPRGHETNPLLRAFLSEATRALAGEGRQVDESMDLSHAQVSAERSIVLSEGGRTRRERRVDLLIEWSHEGQSWVVVVENKILTHDHEGQLDDYAAWVASAHEGANHVLVYLTPDGRSSQRAKGQQGWVSMSYLHLALAWRPVLAASPAGQAWTEALRLYLATVMQGVLRARLKRDLSRQDRLKWMPYLRVAAERKEDDGATT